MQTTEIETPALLVNLDQLHANIQRMQAYCNQHGLAFRPHIKTHKIPEIAQMQVEAGAVGIACQKVSEAEVFAAAGINNIQLPYNIVGASKTARLAELALYNKITASADHISVIAGLADAAQRDDMSIRVLIELDTHLHRTGAPVEEIVTLAQRVEQEEHLHFAGITLYPSTPETRPLIQEALHLLDKAGIGVDSVVGSGIGASRIAHEIPELTELRVGTYIFNDWNTVTAGLATVDECALRIATTVVSRPANDRAIIDSGSKTLSSDKTREGIYGYIVEYPQARIYQLNEEHGYIDLTECGDARPVIGEVVHVIPAHVCTSVNLHDRLYGMRNNEIEVMWQVAARGRVW